MKFMSTDEVRKMEAGDYESVTERAITVGGADGSLYRAQHENKQWIVVNSRGGGTTYKIGGYGTLQEALAVIIEIADDREDG